MTTYLLKSGLCLLLVLVFYKLVLEQRRMPRFNRVYLLAGLLCSALVPLVAVELWPAGSPLLLLDPEPGPARRAVGPLSLPGAPPEPPAVGFAYGWWLYGTVTALMLARFGLNLRSIFSRIAAHPRQPHRGVTLVLLGEGASPHTFLRYLFLTESAYRRGEIEDELFTHELAHARQWHSLDVLLVEWLLCFGWFNPALYFYKRAVQLNHEFLADEAVTRGLSDVTRYQRLLLSKLAPVPPVALTSAFSFQTTKQRLLMMTKRTPKASAWLAGTTATLLLGALAILLGTTTAQITPSTGKQTPVTKRPQPPTAVAPTDVAEMERLYGDKLVILPGRNSPRKKFSELSDGEKQLVQLVPPLPRHVPTEAQMQDWKNAKKYGIWIDEKRVPNSRLNDYAAQDFGSYFSSKLEKNAINYGKHYFQIDLMTKPAYEKYLAENLENPLLILRPDRKPQAK
jgi:hypothetical protein